MKISLNWLTDYVDVSAVPATKLADVLTNIGLCCDEVEQTDADVVFTLDVTSNRPDCLGHIGVARELSAALGVALKLPDLSELPMAPVKATELTDVQVLDADLCPRYTARVLRNVKVGPSPGWMVERLAAVGIRSVNNVVDVTNYVMLEYSQPLHAFDQDLLEQGRIVVRRARPGEVIVSIDGSRCLLNPAMLVICDAHKPVAVAGIMGGLESEIGQKTGTVLLESAQFDPMCIRQTSRHLLLKSESGYRFERGVDPVGVEAASLRACQLILQTGGGELAEGVVDVWAKPYMPPTVTMRTRRCRDLLGADIPDAAQAQILQKLGLSPRLAAGEITCAIPPHRVDLAREADLIEEVIRLHGLDRVPLSDRVSHRVVSASPSELIRKRLREALTAAGLDEAISFTFIDEEEARLFGWPDAVRVDPRVRKTNNLLRPSLLPSLLRACKTNQGVGNEDVNLFELAAVFPPKAGPVGTDAPAQLPDEYVALGIVSQRSVQYVRGAIESALAVLNADAKVEVRPTGEKAFEEASAGSVLVNGEQAGVLGMVSQVVLDYYALEKPHAAAMLHLEVLARHASSTRQYRPLPKLPPVRRDLSLVVAEAVSWQRLSEVIRSVRQEAMESVQYVGTYRGKQIPAGKKSVTLTLTYRAIDQTLRREQADEMVDAVVQAAKQQLGAELRV